MITEEIKKVSSLIRDIVYIAGLIVAAYLFLGKKAVEKERVSQHELTLEKKVDFLIKSDSIRKIQNRYLSDTLRIVVQKQNLMISKQVKSDKGLVELYKSTGKIEELLKWYEQ
jgi:hypothetical protein